MISIVKVILNGSFSEFKTHEKVNLLNLISLTMYDILPLIYNL